MKQHVWNKHHCITSFCHWILNHFPNLEFRGVFRGRFLDTCTQRQKSGVCLNLIISSIKNIIDLLTRHYWLTLFPWSIITRHQYYFTSLTCWETAALNNVAALHRFILSMNVKIKLLFLSIMVHWEDHGIDRTFLRDVHQSGVIIYFGFNVDFEHNNPLTT